jgi:hypothetical protein
LQREKLLVIGLEPRTDDLAAAEFIPVRLGNAPPIFGHAELSGSFRRAAYAIRWYVSFTDL